MKKLDNAFFIFVFTIAVFLFPFNTTSAQVGGYIGVFGGYTLSPDASQWYDDYNYYYNDNYDVDVEETWIFGFKLGYTPPPIKFFSFEFEYSYSNPDLDRTVLRSAGMGYDRIEGDVKFSNFMFNAIAKYPEGKIHPYVGGGLGFSYVDVSVSTTSTGRSASNDDTVFAWQILLGAEIDLTNNLAMDIGYRYFATESESDYDHYYYHDYYNTHLDYETSIVTFGLKYRF
jgi:opacity protein-like surface antigen